MKYKEKYLGDHILVTFDVCYWGLGIYFNPVAKSVDFDFLCLTVKIF